MGSVILLSPAMLELQRRDPGIQFYFLTFAKNRSSVQSIGLVPDDHVLCIKTESFLKMVTSAVRALLRCRSLRFDAVVDGELFSRFSHVFSFLMGATWRVGFHQFHQEGMYCGDLLTHRVSYSPHVHMSDNYRRLFTALECTESTDPAPKVAAPPSDFIREVPRFKVSPDDMAFVEQMLTTKGVSVGDKLILLNPDPGEDIPLRGWPLQSYSALIKKLKDRYPNHKIGVIGLPVSRRYLAPLFWEWGASLIDFTGTTRHWQDLACLLIKSEVLVSTDSGPAHLTALTDTPSVVLFGPENPDLYSPISKSCTILYTKHQCSPCLTAFNGRTSPCKRNVCMEGIHVDQVFEAVSRIVRKDPKVLLG
jgi:ADP-heptose:LPS heptosyltransferase